jgi:homocysteine S-methyltransferase
VLAAIAAAREVTGKPVIVYTNSGEGWDAGRRAWTGQSRYSTGQLRQWIAAGARIAGGCCRIRRADIAVVAQAAADVGHTTAD